ncbi:MAG: 4a-hydroxytetrahydrobiopterin dehydratase [Planctomycetota bacterium]|jgi:4a-hydroxytetrahydrobiopterin dehydratase
MIRKLTEAEIASGLESLVDWSLDQGKLFKSYRFQDFAQAFAFMTQVAQLAEESDHHPEWFNVYATLRVHLTTHEVSGVSERDFDLARAMDRLQP